MSLQLIYKTKKRVIHPSYIRKFVTKVIAKIFNKRKFIKDLEVNLVFVDNYEIVKLNKKYLNKNSPTDVICFKYDASTADIVISLQQVIKNAKIYNTTPKDELLFVITHGLLHFKGMHDDTAKSRRMMYLKAKKLISTINL